MKDEIKEILDDMKKLYDCTTNLQNIIDIDTQRISRLEKRLTNLQERFDALLEAHKIADELETEYQERNEKAIEKIKKIQENAIKYGANHDAIICQDLLNILQGEDKDVKD